MKVLLQARSGSAYKGSAVAAARSVLAAGGVRALYRGMAAPLVGGAAETAVNYAVYGAVRRRLEAAGGCSEPAAAMLAGAAGGAALSLVLSPVELLKCRVQAGEDANVRAALRRVVATTGVRGLAQGLLPTLAREIPGNALYFASYEAMTRVALGGGGGGDGHSWPAGESASGSSSSDSESGGVVGARAALLSPGLAAPLCGGLAGCAYWAAVLPLDAAKTRIQVAPAGSAAACAGLWRTLAVTYKTRGLARGLYAGSRPVLLKGFLANAVQWAAWEKAREWLGGGRGAAGGGGH